MADQGYKYIGTRRFSGLPQGDIDPEAFAKLSAHRKHLVLHSGEWEGANAIDPNPGFGVMKRAELDEVALEYEIDPSAYTHVEDLRAALVEAHEGKGA